MAMPDSTGPLRTRIEHFEHADFSATILLPASAEDLIDEREFEADERLPYWAELWPSALALARHLLDLAAVPERAIELGCGVGLPSLALASRRVGVTATDYYPDALRFTAANAVRNHLPPPATLLLDWRRPPASLPRFPLAVMADVLYEARNVEPLQSLLARVLEPGGAAVLADPGRVYLPAFLRSMETAGWRVERLEERLEDSAAGKGLKTRVQLFTLSPPGAVHAPGHP
jgi:predicted nicotinamide N-methyase